MICCQMTARLWRRRRLGWPGIPNAPAPTCGEHRRRLSGATRECTGSGAIISRPPAFGPPFVCGPLADHRSRVSRPRRPLRSLHRCLAPPFPPSNCQPTDRLFSPGGGQIVHMRMPVEIAQNRAPFERDVDLIAFAAGVTAHQLRAHWRRDAQKPHAPTTRADHA